MVPVIFTFNQMLTLLLHNKFQIFLFTVRCLFKNIQSFIHSFPRQSHNASGGHIVALTNAGDLSVGASSTEHLFIRMS